MQAIDQLKTMREAAHDRLETNPDYRLMVSLDALIVDLEEIGKIEAKISEITETEPAATVHDLSERYEMPTGSRDEVFDHLVAETEEETDRVDDDSNRDVSAISFS